jgi:hypothetical protein
VPFSFGDQLTAALWYVGKAGLVAQRLEQRTHNPSDGTPHHHALKCKKTRKSTVFTGYSTTFSLAASRTLARRIAEPTDTRTDTEYLDPSLPQKHMMFVPH